MKPKGRFTTRCISKEIAVILVISILANWSFFYFPSEKVQAVDASDYMYLFWTNCASPPSGWSVVSDADGEAFYDAADGGLFVRGAASYSRHAGGALTHTHSNTVADTGISGSNSRRTTGSTTADNAHVHDSNSASVDSISSLPAYKNICVIKYDSGIPTGDTAIPNGAVAIFDAAVPSGWSDYSSTFGTNFVRGNSTNGGTGGSNTHQGTGHTVSSITLGGTNADLAALGAQGNASTSTHTHTVPDQTSNTPDTQPPYREIYLGQKTTSAGPIPNGMIAMFDDTDTSVGFSVAGWTRLSDGGGPFNNRFLKVTGAYGSTGGNTAHTHSVINTSSNSGGGDTGTGTQSQTNIDTHTHSVSITLADGTNTNLPPYTDIVIAKKQTAITFLDTDQADYPGVGDIITVDATVNNYHASTNLVSTYIDYVIFIDSDADGRPDAGETYITNGCAGSGVWASGNYTEQTTGVSVLASNSANDQWQCDNTNFPSITTYTLWARWWDGTSYSYNIYDDKGSVTFSSVPTLGQILFMVLVGSVVFIGYKTGVIKLLPKKKSKRGRSKKKGVFKF
ncbi:hypothetical protein ACFL14_00540 [Patescibacteria group bacterium]